MPRISAFYGIVIWMYHDEIHHRGRPHFHARYGEDEASIAAEVDLSYLTEYGGVFEPLKDRAYFLRLRADAEAGTIVWPNDADSSAVPESTTMSRRPQCVEPWRTVNGSSPLPIYTAEELLMRPRIVSHNHPPHAGTKEPEWS